MPSTKPIIAIIGGSGLGQALCDPNAKRHDIQTPFGPPSAPIYEIAFADQRAFLLLRHGEGHCHSPTQVPYRANLFALKILGVTHILASGATGSLREDIHPGELVLVDQIIDKTTARAATFYDKAAVHVEMADPVCPVMRRWLLAAAQGGLADDDPAHLHPTGTYICMEGPSFSTRAESEMHRQWGGDLIGMTAMPEAKLAREAEIAYALIAMPTDYDCWKPHTGNTEPGVLLTEIIGNLKRATEANLALIRQALSDTAPLEADPSPAHEALDLAIWSDKGHIAPAEIQRLRPLWGRHFA